MCARLGGMTRAEMLDRMSARELVWWGELLRLEGEEQEKAADAAQRRR